MFNFWGNYMDDLHKLRNVLRNLRMELEELTDNPRYCATSCNVLICRILDAITERVAESKPEEQVITHWMLILSVVEFIGVDCVPNELKIMIDKVTMKEFSVVVVSAGECIVKTVFARKSIDALMQVFEGEGDAPSYISVRLK